MTTSIKTDGPIYRENRSGNFMHHPVRWGCKPGPYSTARKIVSICIAIFLSFTVIGLFIVIPGIKEWNRQIKAIHQNKPLDIPKDAFLQTIVKFNNHFVKGQINGIYITTNESNLDATRQLLEKHPRVEQAIHIGCATWHNFDVMCARKSKYGLIVDFNPKNADFIKKTIEIIKASDSREVFKYAIISYLNSLEGTTRDLFFHSDQQGLPTERIENELLREGSWLQTEENYLFIKEAVSNDRIAAITETITNSQTFQRIRKYLDLNNIKIDTVYLSNVCGFMRTADERKAFIKSVKHITNKNTIFISCPRLNHLNLETAVRDGELMQDLELESLCSGAGHSQRVLDRPTANDSGSRDCVKLPSPTAVSSLNSAATTILHQIPLLGREILKDSFNSARLFDETLAKI